MVSAAEIGIDPNSFWDMTFRDFALYHEGYCKRIDREMQMLAWACANIMNCWVPKGKPKITVNKLLPRQQKTKVDVDDLPPQNLEEAKDRVRRANERRDVEEFWDSENVEGLTEYMGIEKPRV